MTETAAQRVRRKFDADVERRLAEWLAGRVVDADTEAAMRKVCQADAMGVPDRFTRFHLNQRLDR